MTSEIVLPIRPKTTIIGKIIIYKSPSPKSVAVESLIMTGSVKFEFSEDGDKFIFN